MELTQIFMTDFSILHLYEIIVRENRRDNKELTIQRPWQHWAHYTERR